MGVKLIIGVENKEINNPTVRDINKAIDALDAEHKDPFVVLEVSKENNEFIQVLHFNEPINNAPQYLMEFRCGTFDDYKHYEIVLADKKEIKKMFEKALLSQEFPNHDNWKDKTTEMLDYNNTHSDYSIFEIAKASCRDDKEIINCHGFSHGTIINETTIYQFIAEAIVLCKSILKEEKVLGGIYYSENKKYVYIDIKFPLEWQTFIPDVYRIRGFLSSKDLMQITSYNKENAFIKTNINPLSEYEKLLACILLVFVRYLITDENILFIAMNYFYTSEKNIFMDIYTSFVNNHKSSSYYISYIDADDFDHSNYLSLSELYHNFLDNLEP